MYNGKQVTAAVLAAGAGRRMALAQNKVFLPVGQAGIPALLYSLSALDRHPWVDELVVVIRHGERGMVEQLREYPSFPQKPVRMVEGGEQRYHSVYNALQQISSAIVVIHDGARPLLKQRYISDCIQALEDYAGAAVAVRCTDTLWKVDGEGRFVETQDNHGLYRLQTPQCFRTGILRACHEQTADKSAITDDCTLLALHGYPVRLLPGSQANLKLTYQQDLSLVQELIALDGEISALVHG